MCKLAALLGKFVKICTVFIELSHKCEEQGKEALDHSVIILEPPREFSLKKKAFI